VILLRILAKTFPFQDQHINVIAILSIEAPLCYDIDSPMPVELFGFC